MQTIIIKLTPEKLENPDLDLCYSIPDRIEEVSNGKILDNGYDYLDDAPGSLSSIGIWLKTDSAREDYPMIVELFCKEKIMGNDLSSSVEIYISENDTEDIENCTLVYAGGRS